MARKLTLGYEILENRQVLSVVAVLDSGIDIYHKDLIDNIWINAQEIANDNIDNDNNGYIDDIYGWNFINNNNNVIDVYGHGTHVAGIIQGVNPSVKMIAIKMISDTGSGSTSTLLNALNYINNLKQNGVNIVATNASWTLGSYGSSLVKDKIQTLNNNNIVFVSAAGNNGSNLDINPNYPTSFNLPNIISVASITPDGQLAGSSNYGGNTVTLATYGTSIYSTFPGNRYATMSGTSMAAPFITGKISLSEGSVSDKISLLINSVTKTTSLEGKVITGGFVNVNTKFIIQSPAIPTPIQTTPLIADIYRAGLYNINGSVNQNSVLKIYINGRFITNAKITQDPVTNKYSFSAALGRRYFVRGWNIVAVRDVITGKRLDYKWVRRYV